MNEDLYAQVIELIHDAGFPKKAVWKIPLELKPDFLRLKTPPGIYLMDHYDREYHLMGYPVEFDENVAELMLEASG